MAHAWQIYSPLTNSMILKFIDTLTQWVTHSIGLFLSYSLTRWLARLLFLGPAYITDTKRYISNLALYSVARDVSLFCIWMQVFTWRRYTWSFSPSHKSKAWVTAWLLIFLSTSYCFRFCEICTSCFFIPTNVRLWCVCILIRSVRTSGQSYRLVLWMYGSDQFRANRGSCQC